MALNGITINALVHELSETLTDGRIQKIAQPEERGLILTIHTDSGNKKLYISANASLPLVYLTGDNKPSPLTAYSFVMVLRKYIANAKILSIKQLGLERVIIIELSHLDELKDNAIKYLYIEIMGKHSNIIFTDDKGSIIDAIKHVGSTQSSVREVLPGREYFVPGQNTRMDALSTDRDTFYNKVLLKNTTIEKAIASSFVGFSTLTGRELAMRANLDGSLPLSNLHESELELLADEFIKLRDDIINHNYHPEVILDERNRPLEFSPFHLSVFPGERRHYTDSISEVISLYYSRKNDDNLIKQKTSDLKHTINNCIDRTVKKLALQEKQLQSTDKADTLKLYGELLQVYGHSIPEFAKEATLNNYYDNDAPITIPLDPQLSGIDNSKKYYQRYNKLKRTRDALIPQIESTKASLDHLYSISTSLDMCENESDITSVKHELSEYGFIKKQSGKKTDKKSDKSQKNPPLHFITEDGFELYVGKNNYQNEEVTFKIGRGNDWWFHAKKMPGSHVILKDNGREIPDHVFEIAANLAAYYSGGRDSSHVEVDYLKRKDIKKPPKANPGYVIYYTNYSMMAVPDTNGLSPVK